MTLRRGDLCAVVVALSIAGYPLLASFAALTGLPNTELSIAMRAFVAGLSLFIILAACRGLQLHKPPVLAVAMVVILLLYGVRMTEQILFRPQSLRGSLYWVWFGANTLLPMFAVMVTPSIDWNRLSTILLFVLTTAALLITQVASFTAVTADGFEFETGRVALTTLNPISVGNVGVALTLIALWELFGARNKTAWLSLLRLGAVLLGLYLFYAAGSRGPLVGLALTLVIFALVMRGTRRLWFIFGGGLILATAAIYLSTSEVAEQTRLFARLLTLTVDFEGDGSNTERLSLLLTSIEQILAYPLIGSSIENSTHRFAPHNIILEFTLAGGIFYGAFAVCLLACLVVKAARLIREGHESGGIALLFIAVLIGAQFSSNVYQNAPLWVTAMSIAVAVPRRSRAPSQPEPEGLAPEVEGQRAGPAWATPVAAGPVRVP
jgi:O-antigen ligase